MNLPDFIVVLDSETRKYIVCERRKLKDKIPVYHMIPVLTYERAIDAIAGAAGAEMHAKEQAK